MIIILLPFVIIIALISLFMLWVALSAIFVFIFAYWWVFAILGWLVFVWHMVQKQEEKKEREKNSEDKK